jgi:hypothetical protein
VRMGRVVVGQAQVALAGQVAAGGVVGVENGGPAGFPDPAPTYPLARTALAPGRSSAPGSPRGPGLGLSGSGERAITHHIRFITVGPFS